MPQELQNTELAKFGHVIQPQIIGGSHISKAWKGKGFFNPHEHESPHESHLMPTLSCTQLNIPRFKTPIHPEISHAGSHASALNLHTWPLLCGLKTPFRWDEIPFHWLVYIK